MAIAVVISDLVGLNLFDTVHAATFCSFATVAALYFLDFDGSTRERLGGYAAATAVGLVGLVIGTLVARTLWLAAIAALFVGFAFAFARVLRGYVARSAVGVQMAFVLAVLTPAQPADLDSYLLAWLTGSVIAGIAALVIFPKRHTGELRTALSEWCSRAAVLSTSIGTPRATEHIADLEQARENLRSQWFGTAIRPGMVSIRMRALVQMRFEAVMATRSLSSLVAASPTIPNAQPLSGVCAQGFEFAAGTVVAGHPVAGRAPVEAARVADADRTEQWVGDTLRASGTGPNRGEQPGAEDAPDTTRSGQGATGIPETPAAQAVRELEAHNTVRVLSIAAEAMQRMAARSVGAASPDPTLTLPLKGSVGEQLRANLSWHSFWFRNAIRAAIAVTAAIVVARLLGVEHGVWVAMSVLSLIQVTFNESGAQRSALRTALGAVGGVVIAAVVLALLPEGWMLLAVLPFAAFVAKWAAIGRPGLGQISYTPFAIINMAVLAWPSPTDLTTERLLDILLGMAVALVATFVAFPHGIATIVSNGWQTAHAAAQTCLSACVKVLTDPDPDGDVQREARAAQQELARVATSFSDTVDAAFMSESAETEQLRAAAEREGWLLEALLVSSVFRTFGDVPVRPAAVPSLAAALAGGGGVAVVAGAASASDGTAGAAASRGSAASGGSVGAASDGDATSDAGPASAGGVDGALEQGDHISRLALVYAAADNDTEAIIAAPRALVSATWAAWWFDYLDATAPTDRPTVTAARSVT